jgi:hypothetical protein
MRDLLVSWGVTRAGLLLVALLASQLLVSGLVLQKGNLVYPGIGPLPLQVWSRWDGEWYRLIAERGYRGADLYVAERREEAAGRFVAYAPGDSTGFFPLYPLLLRLLGLLGIPTLAGGVLVANLALVAALRLLRDLARLDEGDEAAERAVWALLCFPTSFFLSAVYAESLMLACLLGSLRAARAGRPLVAGGLAALCALSKPTGILVLLPLLDELVVVNRDRTIAGLSRAAAALAMPCVAVGAYMLYCRQLYGDPLAFLVRQERWRHGALSGPWRAFLLYLESPRLHDAHHSTIDLVMALLCLAAIPWMFLRLRRSYALYGAAAILLPLGSTLWSFSRFAAAIFPLHLLIGALTARSNARFAGYLAIAAPLAGFFMALYAAWWWVG